MVNENSQKTVNGRCTYSCYGSPLRTANCSNVASVAGHNDCKFIHLALPSDKRGDRAKRPENATRAGRLNLGAEECPGSGHVAGTHQRAANGRFKLLETFAEWNDPAHPTQASRPGEALVDTFDRGLSRTEPTNSPPALILAYCRRAKGCGRALTQVKV